MEAAIGVTQSRRRRRRRRIQIGVTDGEGISQADDLLPAGSSQTKPRFRHRA